MAYTGIDRSTIMSELTTEQRNKLSEVARAVGAPVDSLYALIDFESNWNPLAENPRSSARGLLQWIDARAQDLGYSDSAELIIENPTAMQQLELIERDLSRYGPFGSDQELFMSVFYPKAMAWSPFREFPDHVQAVNPGIRTPRDYVNFVWRRVGDSPGFAKYGLGRTAILVIAGIGLAMYLMSRR